MARDNHEVRPLYLSVHISELNQFEMSEKPVTEREYQQILKGMTRIDDSIKKLGNEFSDLKTSVEVMKTTFVTKDALTVFTIKLVGWSVGTIIAATAVILAFVSLVPK